MRIVAGCSSWFAPGTCPLSATPLTNEKLCSVAAEEVQPRVAAAQPAEARSARQFLLGLQRRRDHLAVEVDDRVEHRRQRAPRLAAQAGRRVHVGELARRHRRRREDVARRRARLHGRAREERADRRLRAAAEVAAEHRVAGVGDDVSTCASGISAATALAPEVGVRRSCPPERISVGTFGSAAGAPAAPARRRARRRRSAPGCRPAPSSRRTGRSRRRQARAARRSLRPGASRRGGAALPRERRLLAGRRRRTARCFLLRCRRVRRSGFGRIGTLGTRPSAIRFRRSSGSGSPFSAECTAAGNSARSAGFRSPACRMSSRSSSSSDTAWRLPGAVVGRAAERGACAGARPARARSPSGLAVIPRRRGSAHSSRERRRDRLRSASIAERFGAAGSARPSRAPALRRAGGSVRRTRARPSCRRRCRTARASCSRPRGGSTRCLRPIPAS